MNLTDTEIIKAFGNLYKKLLDVRYDLKITAKEFQALNSVNALVNRQKAEIERLQESIKEADEYFSEGDFAKGIACIINLVKEMTEQSVNYESSKTEMK